MPESDSYPWLAVLILLVLVQVLLVVMVIGMRKSLGRIERRLGGGMAARRVEEAGPTARERAPGGAFEEFLGEDPARRMLTKQEQFAAFREWRRERGLNWSK